MMNLSPTEMDRLIIFTAAEMARRNRRLGIRLSHPEAVAFLTDDHPIAKYSRYTERSFAWGGADDDGAIDFLRTLARDHHLEGWVLIAAGDAELRVLSQHHAELSSIFRAS